MILIVFGSIVLKLVWFDVFLMVYLRGYWSGEEDHRGEGPFLTHQIKSICYQHDASFNGKKDKLEKCYVIKILTGVGLHNTISETFGMYKAVCKIVRWTKFPCEEHFTTGMGAKPSQSVWWGVPAGGRRVPEGSLVISHLSAHPFKDSVSLKHWIWSLSLKIIRRWELRVFSRNRELSKWKKAMSHLRPKHAVQGSITPHSRVALPAFSSSYFTFQQVNKACI